MVHPERLALPIVERKWHTIQSYNLKLLTAYLKIGVTIRRGIYDSPELAFTRTDRDAGPDLAV